jgi:hypothetical protein
VTTNEDVPVTIDVLANDTDPDLDSLTVVSVTQPPNATVTTNGVDVTYRPDPNWSGVDTFAVTISDGTATATAVVTVTVNPVNDTPVLDPVGNQVGDEATLITFTATATDVDAGDTLRFRLVAAPAGATINSATGVFTWTPTEAQGPATYAFDVVVEDDGTPVHSASETITVSVTEINAGPRIDPITDITTAEMNLVTFTATATDIDLPVEPLTFSLAGAPAGAMIDPDTGAFGWTPTETQGPGIYPISVIVTDPAGIPSSTGFVVTVNEANRNPVIAPVPDRSNEVGDGVGFTLAASDADIPANTLRWSVTGMPAGLTLDADTGEITGIVAPGTVGTYTTIVTVTDGAGGLTTAGFRWSVFAGDFNSAPIANDDAYTAYWNSGPFVVAAPGVLSNDTDAQGHVLEAFLEDGPSTLVFNGDGSFVFSPPSEYTPRVTFTYYVVDERGAPSDPATVTIEIRNRAPIANDVTMEIPEDTHAAVHVLDIAQDPDGDDLTLESTTPSVGTITRLGNDEFRYQPPAEFSGDVTIAYTVADTAGSTDSGTITVIVTPVNDPPIAVDDRRRLDHQRGHVIDVLANDSDIEGDPLALYDITEAQHGTVTITSPTEITYDPHNDFVGAEHLVYTVTDGNGGYATAEVVLTVPDAVFQIAVEGAVAVGVDHAVFEPDPEPAQPADDAGEPEAVPMIVIQAVSLMTSAFFQTIGAMDLPLALLFVMLLALWLFAKVTHTPLIGGIRQHTYAAVLLGREDHLEVRPEPIQHAPVIYRDLPAVRGIEGDGRRKHSDGLEWMQIDTPAGQGWVPSDHLMEERDLESFMEDPRPIELLERFAAGLDRRAKLKKVISPRGLVVSIGQGILRYSRAEVLEMVAGEGDSEATALFSREVTEPFLSAHRATKEISPQTPHSATALLPSECRNFLYLTLQTDAAGRPWLVFFEYIDGKPHIVGLGVDR